jgi:VIT1/CCC1 family predicted Fe2+/Mn2+ transporter
MYGKKQHRPVQLGGGLLLMLLPFFVQDGVWLGVASAVLCGLVWGGVKAGL